MATRFPDTETDSPKRSFAPQLLDATPFSPNASKERNSSTAGPTDDAMTMFLGSSRTVPALNPAARADASGTPTMLSVSLEEISIWPPSPAFTPPRAVASPANWVRSVDQTTMVPPSPLSVPSARRRV